MKIIYNPFITGNTFVSQSLLWDTVAAGDAALLEQLLMRAGVPQTVADEDPKKEDVRIDPYIAALSELGSTLFSESLHSEPKGTAKQLLKWRDLLVMVGWTADKTINAQSDKLRVLAQADAALKAFPSRADRWRQVYQCLNGGHKILKDSDSIEVRIPKTLISPLIADVLALLPNVTYMMEKLDASLQPDGHECAVIMPHEQYEAWQLLARLPYDAQTMLVCEDEKRLNDTMQAIGGDQWRTDRVGCPHPATSVYDQKDIPNRLVWLDCAGDGLTVNSYNFLSAADVEELNQSGIRILDEETRSATQMKWLYTVLNSIKEWILVAPKCNMGEPLGEHPIITSLQQHKRMYEKACNQGKTYTLLLKNGGEIVTLTPTGDITIASDLLARFLPPSDSYSTIENLVNIPLDYVLENLGGLTAPEDDKEANEHLIEGPIAHKVVELLVNKNDSEVYSVAEIQSRFDTQFNEIFNQAMADENLIENAQFLALPENANMLAVFKDEARQSIAHLIDVIREKHLTLVRSEFEFTTPFKPFGNPHGFIDMLLEDADGNLVIIDLKWSDGKTYPDKIKNGVAYQLYMYKHAVEAQLKRPVAWYAYYLFPKMELFTEPADAEPKWEEWLNERKARLEQLAVGTVAQADPKKDEYPTHLILKNLNVK